MSSEGRLPGLDGAIPADSPKQDATESAHSSPEIRHKRERPPGCRI